MNARTLFVGAGLVVSAMIGGGVGAALIGEANAATTPSTTVTTTAPSTSSDTSGTDTTRGKWHSNTDAAHEATESPERAAAEAKADASGVAPTGA